MKVEYIKLGLKILLGGAGCLAVIAGISKLFSNDQTPVNEKKTMVDPSTGEAIEVLVPSNGQTPKFNPNSGFGEVGSKIYGAAMCAQTIISGAMNVMNALGAVKTNLDRVFDKSYYNTMLNDPRAAQGYFGNPMIPSNGCYSGYPCGTPVYGDGTTYVRRGQVIECY